MKKIIISGLAVALLLSGCSLGNLKNAGSTKITAEAAKTTAAKFIDENLVQPGTKVEVSQPVLTNGLFKMGVKLPDGRSVEAYMSQDGKLFFPQALNISEVASKATDDKKAPTDNKAPAATTQVPKTAKPKVELFIMSYCPYGTQIEKGIIPAAQALGNKVDFSIKFVNYAMHGKKEVDENLAQYCIQKDQSAKYFPYLSCFLKSSNNAECLKTAKVDTAKLDACTKAADKQFDITKNFNDKSTWQGEFPTFNTNKAENEKYDVQGSPTLVINGVQSEAGRDSASLLKAMCDAFTKSPKECSAKLSSATPAPGFGTGTADASSGDAGCGQ
jgi:hypothetical protein